MSIDFNSGDDLSDLIGGAAPTTPRALPQDETFVRIRATVPEIVESCPKCRGTGRFVSYSGRLLGPCFACKGVGSKSFKNSAPVRAANREKAANRKVVQGDTNMTHYAEKGQVEAARVAWILAKGDTFGFAAAMHEAVRKYSNLTAGQEAAIDRCMASDAERASRKATAAQQTVSASPAVSYPQIRAFLQAAKGKGLKAPGFGAGRIALSMAKDGSRNPGAVYVKWDGNYAGKIDLAGVYRPVGDFGGNAELAAALALIEADPKAWTKTVGIETGSCACCGLTLTDPTSIARGIGPICWDKWGF
jgi:hypothetical protein